MEIEAFGQNFIEVENETIQSYSVSQLGRDWKICQNDSLSHLMLDCFGNCVAKGDWEPNGRGGWYWDKDADDPAPDKVYPDPGQKEERGPLSEQELKEVMRAIFELRERNS